MDGPKHQRLGRGLDALLAAESHAAQPSKAEVSRIKENPFQPRKRFDDDELRQLTASVKAHGVIQPIVVRQIDDHLELIAGERRLRAAQLAGLSEIPVHVVSFDDQQVYEAALVENIQRSDLNAIEKAQGFKDYMTRYGATTEQLGAKLGIDRTSVSNLVNLLSLPGDVQDMVRLGQLTLGHAKILKGVGDKARQSTLARQVTLQGMSVAALDALLKDEKARREHSDETPSPDKPGRAEKTAHVATVENELRQRLSVKVEIRVKAKEKGQIVIGFETNDDFERILEALRK